MGETHAGNNINRFLVMDNKADVFDPTNYYRYGQTVTLAPLTINGYVIPGQQVTILDSGAVATFVYTQPAAGGATGTNGGLAATGMSVGLAAALADGLSVIGLAVFRLSRKAQR